MNIFMKLVAGISILLIAGVAYYLFSPGDNLPASAKWQKTTYMGKMIISELIHGEGDEFKKHADDPIYTNLYRELHIESWTKFGMREDEIRTALKNMQASGKERYNNNQYDTVKEYGPGNWVYEFEQLGDTYSNKGMEAEEKNDPAMAKKNHLLAGMYYKTAAFPVITEAWGHNYQEVANVYDKAIAQYEKAGKYFPQPLQVVYARVDGKTIPGFLHLPNNPSVDKHPAVLSTNGTDFSFIELHPSNQLYLQRWIAVLSFDVPGIGASRDIRLGPDTRLHSAFLTILRSHPGIDANRIGAVGKSLGGHIATRLAFTETDKLKAAANICGPVDHVMHLPTEVIDENFPEMTLDALWSRFKVGRKDHHDFDQIWGRFALVNDRYIAEGKTLPIPLLAFNTPTDPANPLWEMNLLKTVCTNGEVFIGEGEGHCPENENSVIVIDWFAEKLGAGQ